LLHPWRGVGSLTAILLPISNTALLVGSTQEARPVDDETVNTASAELSRTVFVSATNGPREEAYFARLGKRAEAVDESVTGDLIRQSLDEQRPKATEPLGPPEQLLEALSARSHWEYRVEERNWEEQIVVRTPAALGVRYDPLAVPPPRLHLTAVFTEAAKLTIRTPPTRLAFTPDPEFLLRVGRRYGRSCGARGEYDRNHSKQHRPAPP